MDACLRPVASVAFPHHDLLLICNFESKLYNSGVLLYNQGDTLTGFPELVAACGPAFGPDSVLGQVVMEEVVEDELSFARSTCKHDYRRLA